MTALSLAGWGLVGLVVASVLRIAVQRSSLLPAGCERLAPRGLLEVVTAVLFSALAWRIGAVPDLFAYSWLAAAGVLLAAIDWNSRTLPTKLIWPSGIILAALFGMAALLNRDAYPVLRSTAGLLALLAFYGALYFLRPGQLGGGDLRLGGMLGLALGWNGWAALLVGTLLGWLGAAITLVVLRIARRVEPTKEISLGPFLVVGALAAILIQPTT
ncbi:prepilin peptidase [Amycolatopsis sp. K13G38]|uniref:Prepilin peptidase n=1 Tax=Amycolatopsis acididurans TaxID=2724524 RepID=A0ABX1JG93_9PSEU|nr:prepilin peptidase [Amycolatopsis acididurans]NKQ58812.1 prepilin peptidase [Amycolatopsis acididurans]